MDISIGGYEQFYEYRDMTEGQRQELAHCIAKDNLEIVNADFESIQVPDTFYVKYGKRILDILISFIAIIVSAPINLFIMIVTYFDVGHPIIFRQMRIGKDGKLFELIKFRNMTEECDENGVLLPANERVTKWGRFVRKTSLDELLNFWCILKGDMSVIGPRPMPEEYYGRFSKKHEMRHLIKPGLECPLHSPKFTDMNWDNRFENDIWYVQNVSLKVDIKMFNLLIADALWGKRREKRAASGGGCFMGYDSNGKVIDSLHIPQHYYRELFKSGR